MLTDVKPDWGLVVNALGATLIIRAMLPSEPDRDNTSGRVTTLLLGGTLFLIGTGIHATPGKVRP